MIALGKESLLRLAPSPAKDWVWTGRFIADRETTDHLYEPWPRSPWTNVSRGHGTFGELPHHTGQA